MPRRHRDLPESDDDDDFASGRGFDRSQKKDDKPYDPANRDEGSTFDNPGDSRLSRRQGRVRAARTPRRAPSPMLTRRAACARCRPRALPGLACSPASPSGTTPSATTTTTTT